MNFYVLLPMELVETILLLGITISNYKLLWDIIQRCMSKDKVRQRLLIRFLQNIHKMWTVLDIYYPDVSERTLLRDLFVQTPSRYPIRLVFPFFLFRRCFANKVVLNVQGLMYTKREARIHERELIYVAILTKPNWLINNSGGHWTIGTALSKTIKLRMKIERIGNTSLMTLTVPDYAYHCMPPPYSSHYRSHVRPFALLNY